MYKHLSYNQFSKTLVSSISLEALSGVDKANLLIALLTDMGISERLAADRRFDPAIEVIEQRVLVHIGAA